MFLHGRFRLFVNLILLFFCIFVSISTYIEKFQVKSYCLNNKNEKYYSNLISIPQLNILFCDIPKAASTNLRRLIYGYLNQSNTLTELNRKQIWIDNEEFFKKFYLTENSEVLFNHSNLFKFLIVRHPFQRIYSVYYDKFVNNHLDDTLFGWKQLEEDILVEMKFNETLLTIRRHDLRLDFRTFVLYIINSIRKNRLINSHWEQIVQRCGVCLIKYNWIGKIENFHRDEKILINKLNKNSKKNFFEFPSKQIDQKQTNQILFNDLQLFEFFRDTIHDDDDFRILINYYKPDFQMFNYHLPNL